jgi:hypothetical protein
MGQTITCGVFEDRESQEENDIGSRREEEQPGGNGSWID